MAPWVLPALTAALLTTEPPAAKRESWEARFRSEYPAALQRLKEAADNVEYEADLVVESGGQKITSQRTYRLNGPYRLWISEKRSIAGKPDDDVVRCWTPEHTFLLRRSKNTESEDRPWIIRNAALTKVEPPNPEKVDVETISDAHSCFEIGLRPVGPLLEPDKSEITGVSEVAAGPGAGSGHGPNVEFTFKSLDKSSWAKGGKLVLAPDLDWAVASYDIELNLLLPRYQKLPSGTRVTGIVQSKRWPGVGVFPTKVEISSIYPSLTTQWNTTTIKEGRRLGFDKSAYNLSAFNLDDSLLAESGTTRTALRLQFWLSGLGLVFLVLTVVLQRGYARAKARTSGEESL